MSKLTKDEALSIRISLYMGIRPSLLSKLYKVHETTISDIKNFTTWKHVGGPKPKRKRIQVQ